MFIELTDYVYGKIFVNAHRVVSCRHIYREHTQVVLAGNAFSCKEKIKDICVLIALVGAKTDTGIVELTRKCSNRKVTMDVGKIAFFHDTRLGETSMIADGAEYELKESTSEILALIEASKESE